MPGMAIHYIKDTSLRAFRAQAGSRRRTLGRALARTGHARVRSSAAGTAATSSRRSTAGSPSPRRSAASSQECGDLRPGHTVEVQVAAAPRQLGRGRPVHQAEAGACGR